MPRNLILLLDGTSNEVKNNLTNVVKLYRCAERSDNQRVFYHPGVGWDETESQIAKFPSIWMAREGQKHGLELNEALFDHFAEGVPLPGGKHIYVAPDAKAPMHNSMTAAWWPFEYLPRTANGSASGKFDERRLYLPRAEPRKIPEGALLHHSVIERMARGYEPVNLPSDFMPVPRDPETPVQDENGQ